MTTRITFDVTDNFHKMIKTYATLSDKSIKDYIIEKLQEAVSIDLQRLKANIPNDTTLKALEETKNNQIEEFDSAKHLFAALEEIEKNAKD